MEAIESLKRAIHITGELQSLVKTMKVLAGLNIRQCERASHAIGEYNRTVEMGLEVALRHIPESMLPVEATSSDRLAAIVFGSDQGMCGQLNDLVTAHACKALQRLTRRRKPPTLLAVGQRVSGLLEDSGFQLEQTLDVPGSIAGISGTIHDVLHRVDEWHREGIPMVALFYCGFMSGVLYKPRGVLLLPADLRWIRALRAKRWPTKVIPDYSMDTARLYRALLREYLFVVLFRALADSLASENAARLASMQVAERNIEERLKTLTSDFHQCRQSTITSELLDIISAFEALRPKQKTGKAQAA